MISKPNDHLNKWNSPHINELSPGRPFGAKPIAKRNLTSDEAWGWTLDNPIPPSSWWSMFCHIFIDVNLSNEELYFANIEAARSSMQRIKIQHFKPLQGTNRNNSEKGFVSNNNNKCSCSCVPTTELPHQSIMHPVGAPSPKLTLWKYFSCASFPLQVHT